MAESWARVAGPHLGRRGQMRSEEAEIALTTTFLWHTLFISAVKGEAFSLLGRLEGLGPWAASAASQSSSANMMELSSQNLRQSHPLSVSQGRDLLRRGQLQIE